MKPADVLPKDILAWMLMLCMAYAVLLPVAYANDVTPAVLRGEVILVIAQHHGQYEGNRGTIQGESIPSDYVEAVNWAYNRQILAGMPTGIAADEPITRQDYMCLLSNYVDYLGVELELVNNWHLDSPFKDASSIAEYALTPVIRAYDMGILSEKTKTMFVPEEYITQAEANEVWHKFLNRLPVYVAPNILQAFWDAGYVPKTLLIIVVNMLMVVSIGLSYGSSWIGSFDHFPAAGLFTCALVSLPLLFVAYFVGAISALLAGDAASLLTSVLNNGFLVCIAIVAMWACVFVPLVHNVLEKFHDKMLFRLDSGTTGLSYVLYVFCFLEVLSLCCLSYVVFVT